MIIPPERRTPAPTTVQRLPMLGRSLTAEQKGEKRAPRVRHEI